MAAIYEQLLALQDRAAEIISGIDYLSGYDVATESKGDLKKQIAQALSTLGLCMIVLTPETRIKARNGDRIVRDVTVEIGCYETPILNSKSGVRKTALAAAAAIATAIEGASNGQVDAEFASSDDPLSSFLLNDNDISLIPDDKTGILIYRVSAHTEISTIKE